MMSIPNMEFARFTAAGVPVDPDHQRHLCRRGMGRRRTASARSIQAGIAAPMPHDIFNLV
jgi:hypothetical protein